MADKKIGAGGPADGIAYSMPELQELAQSARAEIDELLQKEVAGNLTDNELKIGLQEVKEHLDLLDNHIGKH